MDVEILAIAKNGAFLSKTTENGRSYFTVMLPFFDYLTYPAMAEQSARRRFETAANLGR